MLKEPRDSDRRTFSSSCFTVSLSKPDRSAHGWDFLLCLQITVLY